MTLRVLHGLDKGLQTLDGGAPVGNAGVRADEPGHRALHLTEGLRRLRQAAELNLPGKVTRRGHQDGEDDGELAIKRAVPGEQLLPLHDAPPVAPHIGKAVAVSGQFALLAVVERNAFVVFAGTRQTEAEIRLVALLVEVEPNQRLAHPMRQHAAHPGIQNGDPHHVTGNGDAEQGDRARQHPQHDQKRKQRDQRGDEAEKQIQAAVDETADVVGDALVRVVGVALPQRHAVMRAAREPVFEKHLGHPAPPVDLQHLQKVLRIHRQRDVEKGVASEIQQQLLERAEILRLQRIEKIAVPLRELHIHPNQRQIHRQHQQKQTPALFFLFRNQVRFGERIEMSEGEAIRLWRGLRWHEANGSRKRENCGIVPVRAQPLSQYGHALSCRSLTTPPEDRLKTAAYPGRMMRTLERPCFFS